MNVENKEDTNINNIFKDVIGDRYKVCFDDGTGDEMVIRGVVDYFDGQRVIIISDNYKKLYIIKLKNITTMIPEHVVDINKCKAKSEDEILDQIADETLSELEYETQHLSDYSEEVFEKIVKNKLKKISQERNISYDKLSNKITEKSIYHYLGDIFLFKM